MLYDCSGLRMIKGERERERRVDHRGPAEAKARRDSKRGEGGWAKIGKLHCPFHRSLWDTFVSGIVHRQ